MKEGARSRSVEGHCRFGHYTLDTVHATLRDDNTGKIRVLTTTEAKILQLLAENKNEVIRREAILSRCWNTEDDFSHPVAWMYLSPNSASFSPMIRM